MGDFFENDERPQAVLYLLFANASVTHPFSSVLSLALIGFDMCKHAIPSIVCIQLTDNLAWLLAMDSNHINRIKFSVLWCFSYLIYNSNPKITKTKLMSHTFEENKILSKANSKCSFVVVRLNSSFFWHNWKRYSAFPLLFQWRTKIYQQPRDFAK